MTMTSGTRSNVCAPNQFPVRPKAVTTSSSTSRMPCRRRTWWTRGQYPSGGGIIPPTPMTGSPKKAATRSAPTSSMVRSSSSIRKSVASGPKANPLGVLRWTNPGANGSNPSFRAGMPVAASDAEATPWYAAFRARITLRSGSPRACQASRTSLMAVSIPSDPPFV